MSHSRRIEEVVSILRITPYTAEGLYKYLTVNETNFTFDLHATCSYTGSTILHAACEGGNAVVVGALLKMGMQTHQLTLTGKTALMLAMTSGSLACVELLVKHGARLDGVINESGTTYLDYAFQSASVSEEITSYLRSLPIAANLKPESGENKVAAQRQFVEAILAGEMKAAKNIFDQHLIDVGDNLFMEPAVREGKMDVIKLLVECGSYVVGKSISEKTLPMIARESGHEEIAQYLEAVQRGRFEILRDLMQQETLIGELVARIALYRKLSQNWLGINCNSKADELEAALNRAQAKAGTFLSVDELMNYKLGDSKSINEALNIKRIGFFQPTSRDDFDNLVLSFKKKM